MAADSEASRGKVSIHEIPKTQLNYNFEIRCSGHTWVVHRANLCTKSRFFKALCDGPFQEGVNGFAEIHDEDPERIERMLLAVSTPRYPVTAAEHRPEKDLIEDAKLYAIADRYDIPTLRSASADAFKVLLDDVATRKSPMLFIEKLLPILYETTSATDRVLRASFEAFVKQQMNRLLPRGDLHNFAMQNKEFGAFILKVNLEYWEEKGERWCDTCKDYKIRLNYNDSNRNCCQCDRPFVR